MMSMTATLILDEDGVYDPAELDDRLLLGLIGAAARFARSWRKLEMCFGAGSRRRSAPQVSDLIDSEGVTRSRRFTSKLRGAGYNASFRPVAAGVADYVQALSAANGNDGPE
jgi:hypothetical protein